MYFNTLWINNFEYINNTTFVGVCQQRSLLFLLKSYIKEILEKGEFKVDLSQAIRIRINNLINEKNISISKLCTLAGISRSTLSKFMSGKRRIIRLDIIEYICEGLNIKLKDFFNDEVFDNIEIKE